VRTRHVLVSAAALVALAGCGSKPAAAPVPAPAASAPAPAPSSSAIDAETLDATSAYLTALGKLDQKLVADQRAALDDGMNVCVDIEQKKTTAEQERNVAAQFEVDAAQAKKILEVTKSNLCLNE
jgi:hypothetical protein